MAIIPTDRLPIANTWETSGVEGGVDQYLPGGANERTNLIDVTQSPYNVDNTGVVSAVSGIQSAIDLASVGDVVFCPAGTYLVDSGINHRSGITLRGDSPGVNTLPTTIWDIRTPLNVAGSMDSFPPPKTAGTAVSSGSTQGSTTITVADSSNVTVGDLMNVNELDDTTTAGDGLVWTKGGGTDRFRGSLHKISSKTATTITFEPALLINYSDTPEYSNYGSPIELAGVEYIKFDLANGTAGRAVDFEMAWNCWLYGCEVTGHDSRTVWINWSGHVEVRRCYMHDQTGGGPNSEGIELFTDAYRCKVVDNICVASGFPQISIGGFGQSDYYSGSQGNVVAYNYAINAWTSSPPNDANIMPADIGMCHAPHNMFNLVEGNYTGKIHADCFFGSSSHGTILRNRIKGNPTSYPKMDSRIGLQLDRRQLFYNVVGNIIGDSNQVPEYEFIDENTPWLDSDSTIYRLGFPNVGTFTVSGVYPPTALTRGDGGSRDSYCDRNDTTYGTTIIEGNWDSLNDAQDWTITPEAIPDSYYLSEKPGWWGSSVWPPYDPETPTEIDPKNIPAGARYLTQINPSNMTKPDLTTTQPQAALDQIKADCDTLNALGVGTSVITASDLTNALNTTAGEIGVQKTNQDNLNTDNTLGLTLTVPSGDFVDQFQDLYDNNVAIEAVI